MVQFRVHTVTAACESTTVLVQKLILLSSTVADNTYELSSLQQAMPFFELLGGVGAAVNASIGARRAGLAESGWGL